MLLASCSVILLDWDDTLLCSSHLAANGVRLDSPLPDLSTPEDPLASDDTRRARELVAQLRELEACVHQLLSCSIERADRCCIITNAGRSRDLVRCSGAELWRCSGGRVCGLIWIQLDVPC